MFYFQPRHLFITCLFIFVQSFFSFGQILNDPFGSNEHFKDAVVMEMDSFNLDRIYGSDVDVFYFSGQDCGGFELLYGISGLSASNRIAYMLYRADDTTNVIMSGVLDRVSPEPLYILGEGGFFLRINSIETDTMDYAIKFSKDSTDLFECNNNPENANPIEANSNYELKLNGYTGNGLPDEDWFRFESETCGVLSLGVFGANPSQKICISIFNNQLILVDKACAESDGEQVIVNAQIDLGSYFIQITDFDTCCGTGNDTIYNLSPDVFLLDVKFDGSDKTECNNSFASAFSIKADTVYTMKLWGRSLLNPGRPEDQEFLEFTPSQCGVFELNTSNVPSDQALELSVFNENLELINYGLSACHGCQLSLSTLVTAGRKIYVKISEFDGCCTGNNAIYNLSESPFRLSVSFDSSDVYECNNLFANAPVFFDSDSVLFKIKGRNLLGRYGDADLDIYKFYSESCAQINVSIDQIPAGFDLQTRLFKDTLNLQNHEENFLVQGPDSLSFSLSLQAGEACYLSLNENGNNASSNQLIRLKFSFSFIGPETPVISMMGGPGLCPGDSIILSSSIDLGNNWSTGDTTAQIIIKAPGTYYDTIFDSGGCFAASTPINIYPLESPQAAFTYEVLGAEIKFEGTPVTDASYSWNFGDGNTSSEINPAHTYESSGTYEVTLIVANECGRDTTTQTISSPVSLNSLASDQTMVIPQPSDGMFLVRGLKASNNPRPYRVLDARGRLVASGSLLGTTEQLFKLSLQDGFYFLLMGNGLLENKIPILIQNQ